MLNYLDIISRVKEKDGEIVGVLYNTYGKKLYCYGRQHWEMDEDEAWEAVYRTLEAIMAKSGDYPFESQAHFDNYLFKIYVNYLRQAYRTKVNKADQALHYVDLSSEIELPGSIAGRLTQEAIASYQETDVADLAILKQLKQAIGELETLDRELLLLRVQNYSYAEISSFLQIENKQLKVRYHRAKQKLAEKLREFEASH